MKRWIQAFRISCTYIGTMVGAGFASGQEILQFFTQYGRIAPATIALAGGLFLWIGTKQMLLAHRTGCSTYEELNCLLFGDRFGRLISHFMTLVLFGTTAVMLAGAGSVFSEHLHLSFQLGLMLTAALAYIVLSRGMEGILSVNSVIVPFMLLFVAIIVITSILSPEAGSGFRFSAPASPWKGWFSPFLYAALNLCLAQAVLVPIGYAAEDGTVLRRAGLLGGAGMGVLLFAAHFALSTHMPGIAQFEIPMAFLIHKLGPVLQNGFLIVIYSEIFTTLIADAFGVSHHIRQRVPRLGPYILPLVLAGGILISQIGFSRLVSTLYPLFGFVSLGWLFMMIRQRL